VKASSLYFQVIEWSWKKLQNINVNNYLVFRDIEIFFRRYQESVQDLDYITKWTTHLFVISEPW